MKTAVEACLKHQSKSKFSESRFISNLNLLPISVGKLARENSYIKARKELSNLNKTDLFFKS